MHQLQIRTPRSDRTLVAMTDTPAPPATTRTIPGAGPALWIGLLVVLAAAAALSFDALHDLAVAVRMPPLLAPLLPIAIDAGAAVSCATWLSHRVDDSTAHYARRMTYCLLTLTVVGNAAQLGMHANDLTPPWWAAVAVGAVPPAVVGATVHLIVLVSRASPRGVAAPTPRTTVDEDLRRHAEQLVTDGAGRPRIATELGLTDHQARRLVQDIRQELRARSHGDHEPTTAGQRLDHYNDPPGPYPSSGPHGAGPPASVEQG